MNNLNEHGQDTGRDPAYADINFTHEGSYCIYTPIQTSDQPISVRILGDEDDGEQERLAETFPGNYMNECPSIELVLPRSSSSTDNKALLTWEEAYNLGRALIEKANEAHYG